MGDPIKLLSEIEERIAKAKSQKKSKPKTRAEVSRENGAKAQGPKTEEGKARASTNSLKHGYYASLAKLNPRDSLAFHHINSALYNSLHPDGPAETHLVEEIAMLNARLQSLEAAQFALIAGNTDGEPQKIEHPESYTDGELYDLRQPDARDVAHAYERCLDTLERLNKIEVHLRRAYNRTWDRLERIQKERHKLPQRTGRLEAPPKASSVVRDMEMDETIKRTQARLTIEPIKQNRPQDIPAPHPDLDEQGKFKQYKRGDPLCRPKEKEGDSEKQEDIDPGWH